MPSLPKAAPYLVLAAALAIVFGQAVSFDFVTLDDPINITRNPYYQPLSWSNLTRLLSVAYCGLFIPLTYAFWAVLAVASRLTAPADAPFDPRIFHAANLVLHFVCGAFVYRLALALVRSPVAALLGALVFLLHPLQVESVCWVTETKGLLATAFSLAALWLVVRSLEQGDSTPGALARSKSYLWATFLFALGLLSKPSVVTLPLVLVCLLWLHYRWPLRVAVSSVWDWFVIAGIWVIVTRFAQPTADLPIVTPLWQRPFVAGDAWAFYLQKLVWPWPLGMDYGRTPTSVMASPWAYVAWMIPLAVGAVAWLSGLGVVRAGAAIALAAPLPVLGLLPFQFQRFSTVADRYMYFSLFGVALVVAGLIAKFPRALTGVVALVVVALASASFVQAQTWRDGYTLLTHGREVNASSVAVLVNLGVVHQERNEHDQAAACFEEALQLDPASFEANTGQGTILLRRQDLPGALAHFEEALALHPEADRPNAGAAAALHGMGDSRRAAAHYRRAADPDPRKTMPTLTPIERASAANALARILATDRDDALRNGAEALAWAAKAVALTGQRSPLCLDTYAAALAETEQFEEAVRAIDRAIPLANTLNDKQLIDRLRAHRDLFVSRQPLRETPQEQMAQ